MGESEAWKQISFYLVSLIYFLFCLHPYTKENNKIFVQMFRCVVTLWKSWVCKYSIRFQVINLWNIGKWKNEKFLLDIQTKCGDITNKILNAERTFKCKWPKLDFILLTMTYAKFALRLLKDLMWQFSVITVTIGFISNVILISLSMNCLKVQWTCGSVFLALQIFYHSAIDMVKLKNN